MLARRCVALLAVTAPLFLDIAFASGQTFPNRPIRFLVGFAPGGNSDTVARIVAPRLSQRLGQQVVIDNRAGAAGNIAAEIAAKAAPNGHTILMASSSNTVNASLYPSLPFNMAKDFAAIILVSSAPFVLVVNNSMPATSVRELVAYARSRPGQLNYASAGATTHLATELFLGMAGVSAVNVPYKSSALAISDLIGAQVAMMFSALPAALPHISSGRLRALGVTSGKRLGFVPDLPTIAESGLATYEVSQWSGVVAPAATPRNIVATLHREIAYIMNLADVRERLPALGLEPMSGTSGEFAKYLDADIRKWARVARESGARLD